MARKALSIVRFCSGAVLTTFKHGNERDTERHDPFSLVQNFAVQSLLLQVGLPSPSVLLVGEGDGVTEPENAEDGGSKGGCTGRMKSLVENTSRCYQSSTYVSTVIA